MDSAIRRVAPWGRMRLRGRIVCVLFMLAGTALAQEDPAAADAEPASPSSNAGPPAAEALTPQDAGDIVSRFELQVEFENLLAAEDYSAAAALAGRLIDLAEQEFGAENTMFADTLIQAAEAQTGNEDFAAAQENALRALEIYREQEGQFAESLIRPYLVLGDSYQAAEDPVSAMAAYEEARNVSRRVDGLLNPGQIEILERMSASAEASDQMLDAQEYQREALELVERRYEPYAPEVVEAALRYGAWLRDHDMYTPERELYGRIERTVSDEYGSESIELVPLLLARANSYRRQALYDVRGISALRLARDLVEDSGDVRLRAEAYRDLGDWEAAFYEHGTDGSAYLASWEMLGEVENGDDLREEWFGAGPAHWVLTAARSRRAFSTDPDAATGQLIIRFTVEPTGLTSGVSITDADPPGVADEAFARQIRASRFRPRIRDGRLVPVRRAYIATFRYEPEDDD